MAKTSDERTVWPPRPPERSPPGAEAVPFEVSDHVTPFAEDAGGVRALADRVLPAGGRPIKLAVSLCPDCLAADRERMTVPMALFERGGAVRVRSVCPDHGAQTDAHWSDAGAYRRARRLDEDSRHPLLAPERSSVPPGEGPPEEVATSEGDPTTDCGRPSGGDCCGDSDPAATASGIGNVAVTNRCDRSCHYCFFYADDGESLHEPTKAEIREMCARLGSHDAVGAIQLTGGEPTVRDDVVEIVEIASEHADQVLLNTHGGRFLAEPALAHEVSAAGARGLYTSFDGVDPEHNYKSYWEFPHALSAVHHAGMCAMLVPTVVGGWNDHQLGDVVRFGAANADTVCGVNFQPVSFVGRMDSDPDPDRRREQRITIPDVMTRVEDQTDGAIPTEAWVPLPVYRTISEFTREWTGDGLYGVQSTFSSWMVTTVFVDGDDLVPITDVLDVEAIMYELVDLLEEFGTDPSRLDKARVATRVVRDLDSLLGDRAREDDRVGGRLRSIARTALKTGEFEGIDDLYDNLLPVGIRHFQDPYNYDLDALAESDVHYAMPDGQVVPFSVYNVFPDRYRDRVKEEYAVSVADWLDREYASLDSAAAEGRTRRGTDVVDPEVGASDGDGDATDDRLAGAARGDRGEREDLGVFGVDVTYDRNFDEDFREVVRRAYRASIEDLDPVWTVIDHGDRGDAVDCGDGCCGGGC